MPLQESHICPRCHAAFTCNAEDITSCHCYDIRLSAAQRIYIAASFSTCLCNNCLKEIRDTIPGEAINKLL